MARYPSCLPVFLVVVSSVILTGLSQVDFCEDYATGNQVVVRHTLVEEVSDGTDWLQDLVDCLTDGGLLIFEESLEIGTLRIESSIRIQGRSEEATFSITCRDGPIFLVNATGVQLNNLEINGCRLSSTDAPVVLLSGSRVELNSVNFTNNRNEAGPAALKMYADSELTVRDCHFSGNSGNLGTLHITHGNSLTISSSTFESNTAYLGGAALRIESELRRTTVVIEDGSLFENNEAIDGEGGAILATGNVGLTIGEDTSFKRNIAANQGGALFLQGSSTLRIKDAFFVENESDFIGGGAIFAENSTSGNLDIQISNTVFSKNVAKNRLGSGGAIRLEGTGITCKIERGTSFVSNLAELDGGAIHVSEGLATNIRKVFFIGNEVRRGGGAALYAMSSVYVGVTMKVFQLNLNSCLFFQNRAQGRSRGGGALVFTGSGTNVNVNNCWFHENESLPGLGGVLYLFNGPSVTISKSNFTDNRATRGGSFYAERDAKCNISECKFYRNEAEQGGVINARSAVSISIEKSELKDNTALEAGGAIYAESHISLLSDRARLSIVNSNITNNTAAIQTISNALDSVETRGGAIVVIGDGQHVYIANSYFHNNSALEGGAIASIGTKSFLVSNESSFELNQAEFGGALFLFVDEAVDLSFDTYNVNGSKFFKNNASDGGAIWIGSTSSGSSYFPFNADQVKVHLQALILKENNASNVGGGMMIRGVGVIVTDSEFSNNIAKSVSDATMAGSGGAVASMDGARAIIFQTRFWENIAKMDGGALYVNDASARATGANFTQNSVTDEFGNGGAVALELTSSRTLPLFDFDSRSQYSMLQCNKCIFEKNRAPLYGGAIYHHLSDPRVNYSELWNCNDAHERHFSNMPRGQEHNVSCPWVEGIRSNLEQRSIRLSNVTFEDNMAHSGAALFTNYLLLISVTNGDVHCYGLPFMNVIDNDTFLEEEGIIFKSNAIAGSGYGKNYATIPTNASLYNKDNLEGTMNLTFRDFRSGDSFKFEIRFVDDFRQNVSYVKNFSAEVYVDEVVSEDEISPLYGQTRATMQQNGSVIFRETRLRGKSNTTYKLSLRYFYLGQEMKMNDTTFVEVAVRPCKIGEFTVKYGNGVIECRTCRNGQFSFDPLDEECQSCQGLEGVECHGNAAVPKDKYWQYSSFSTNMQECTSREACAYINRTEEIRKLANESHEAGRNLSFEDLNHKQCSPGYAGILCGSCNSTHGKEGDQCRKCASRPLRYFFLSLLIFWSLVLVGCFIRSVLQLSKRIEFNKKFGRSAAQQGTGQLAETLPATSSTSTELRESEIRPDGIQHLALEMSTSVEESESDLLPQQIKSYMHPLEQPRRDWNPTISRRRNTQRSIQKSKRGHHITLNAGHSRVKRQTKLASRLHRLRSGQAPSNLKLLTLMNPASEVLKIMINFLQVTSVAIFINLTWSEEVRRALTVVGTIANLSTGGGYFSLDCFLIERSMAKSLRRMMLLVLYPLFIFLVFVLVWGIRALIKSKSLKYFRHRIWLAFLSIIYIFYIGVTKNLLRFFVCRSIKVDETVQHNSVLASALSGSFWEEDTSVKCFENDHLWLVMFFVVPLLCLVSIGFPLGTLLILHLKANHLEDDNVIGTYGFLYQAYNKPYWEVVIMLRKALIAAVTVFPRNLGANIQGLLCVFILFISLICHLLFRPFKAEAQNLNHLESCSLSATIAVFLSGLVFNDPKTTGTTDVFLSVLAITCVVGTLLLMIFNLLMSSEELIDMLVVENGIVEAEELIDQRLSFKLAALVMYYFGKIGLALNRRARGASSRRNPVQNQRVGGQITNQVQNA